jgi:hypothetical protein
MGIMSCIKTAIFTPRFFACIVVDKKFGVAQKASANKSTSPFLNSTRLALVRKKRLA